MVDIADVRLLVRLERGQACRMCIAEQKGVGAAPPAPQDPREEGLIHLWQCSTKWAVLAQTLSPVCKYFKERIMLRVSNK